MKAFHLVNTEICRGPSRKGALSVSISMFHDDNVEHLLWCIFPTPPLRFDLPSSLYMMTS